MILLGDNRKCVNRLYSLNMRFGIEKQTMEIRLPFFYYFIQTDSVKVLLNNVIESTIEEWMKASLKLKR